MTERILIVEDEKSIARVLELELKFEGYETTVALTGSEALIQFREQEWDLVLLDAYGEDNVPVSDHGLLVLQGPERLWLLRPFTKRKKLYVALLPGTEEAFREEMTALL